MLLSPSMHRLTASALRASGTTEIISLEVQICCTDTEIACVAFLADLLFVAGLMESDDQMSLDGRKIRWRIVES